MGLFKPFAWSCLVLAPLSVHGSACKPQSTDLSQTSSFSLSTASTEVSTISSSDVLTTSILDLSTTLSSEAPSVTSTAPCPRWTEIIPPPSNKICGKDVARGDIQASPLYLGSNVYTNGIVGCAKHCGDTNDCVSFYAEDFVAGSGAPTYKLCFFFKGYEKDLPFGPGFGRAAYYEQGCFACVRD